MLVSQGFEGIKIGKMLVGGRLPKQDHSYACVDLLINSHPDLRAATLLFFEIDASLLSSSETSCFSFSWLNPSDGMHMCCSSNSIISYIFRTD